MTNITLMFDEIHIKQYFDYKEGNVGLAFNGTQAGNSAFVFMLGSLLSKLKDVVILPTKTMQANILFKIIKVVIIGSEKIVFRVICVVTDSTSSKVVILSLSSTVFYYIFSSNEGLEAIIFLV